MRIPIFVDFPVGLRKPLKVSIAKAEGGLYKHNTREYSYYYSHSRLRLSK